MLSTKYVRIHGMKDQRWTIRDKINQYRGVLKLHSRDRKVRTSEAAKLKKRVSKDLKGLIGDIKEYRGVIRDVEYGEKRRMHTVLHEHRDFQLAYENLDPDAIEDGVFQDSCLKRRQLDKLYYQKKKKMKEFFDLKLECAILADKYEREQESLPNYEQQTLITEYQQFMAKQNAAKSIRTTYHAMLKILEKDNIYFDAVIESLREDRHCQCKVLLRATVMGQLAAENLDDVRRKYKFMAREVWINMKERERTLGIVRSQVEDLWAYAQSLVRVESDTNLATKVTDVAADDKDQLNRQIRQLDDVFQRVKDSLAVSSYEELFIRLEAQIKQRKRLVAHFEKNFKERDALLNSKNHALLTLATLEHSVVSTTGQYKTDKKIMLEEIETQKKREIDLKTMRKKRGELLVNIRSGFQNMLSMLICVRDSSPSKGFRKSFDKDVQHEKTTEREVDENVPRRLETGTNVKFNVDALTLLAQVNNKVNKLFAMSNFDLDPNEEDKARDLYQRYIADYRSKMILGEDEAEATGISVEHELIDSSVLSRAEIKLRSKYLVEANTKLE